MATRAPITSAFIAKLLAPIPVGEEQADTPKFRKWLIANEVAVWSKFMEKVDLAECLHRAAALSLRDAGRHDPRHQDCLLAYQAYRRAVEAQCLIAAPTPVQARWKRRMMKGYKISQEVSDAIMADDQRFSV